MRGKPRSKSGRDAGIASPLIRVQRRATGKESSPPARAVRAGRPESGPGPEINEVLDRGEVPKNLPSEFRRL